MTPCACGWLLEEVPNPQWCLLRVVYFVTADCGLGGVSVQWSAQDVTIRVTPADSYMSQGHLLAARTGRIDVWLGADLGSRRIRGAAQPGSVVWGALVPQRISEDIARLTVEK